MTKKVLISYYKKLNLTKKNLYSLVWKILDIIILLC